MLKAPWRVYGECAHEHAAGKADFFEHGRLSTVLKRRVWRRGVPPLPGRAFLRSRKVIKPEWNRDICKAYRLRRCKKAAARAVFVFLEVINVQRA